jgi:hypothetical protein
MTPTETFGPSAVLAASSLISAAASDGDAAAYVNPATCDNYAGLEREWPLNNRDKVRIERAAPH